MIGKDKEGGESLKKERALLYGPHDSQALQLDGRITLCVGVNPFEPQRTILKMSFPLESDSRWPRAYPSPNKQDASVRSTTGLDESK